MKGLVSFHPVDLALYDELVAPLLAGKKVDPESFVKKAIAARRNAYEARRFSSALETIHAGAGPPKPEPGAGVLKSLKTRLEAFDYRPDEVTRIVVRTVDPELHVHGRPYCIGEVSAGRVADAVAKYASAPSAEAVTEIALEQLGRLDPGLPKLLEPVEGPQPSPDLVYRGDLLTELTTIHDIARLAREGKEWKPADGPARPAADAVKEEIPWRAAAIHARIHPFWIARDLDGLETVCRGTGVAPHESMIPAWRLFAESVDAFPGFKESFHLELDRPRDIAVFVAPADVPAFIEFLNEHGGRIIAAAVRAGEGPACTMLLRKIKECATYATKHGFGYLEASGIMPPDLVDSVS